jgi:exodeoxyribonuclease V gamma subunit
MVPEDAAIQEWTRDQLVRALCHPPREFLCERLGLRLPEGSERLPDEEPFDSRDGLLRYQLNQRVFELQVQQPAPAREQLGRRLLAEGRVPPAAAGEAAVDASVAELESAVTAWRAADGGEPISRPYSLELDGVRLSGALERVFPDGLRQFSASRGHGKTLIALGVDVLVWSALGETRPVLRVLRDGAATPIAPLPADLARAKLAQLLRLAQRARREALPLMPKAGAKLACDDDPEKGLKAATADWTGTGGEGADPWVRLALRGAMPFEQHDATLRMTALARSLFLGLPGGLPCADLDELSDGH